jgi:Asp-tRNA(Asn)/Glu-tRNA(Gln) amidotransferase A subunit family amidase
MSNQAPHDLLSNRRQFIGYFTSIGLSSTLLPGVLWAKVHQQKAQRISKEMLTEAEKIAGLHFTEAQRDMMVEGVNQNLRRYDELRQIHLDVSVAPALRFSPILPGMKFDTKRLPFRMSKLPNVSRPQDVEEVAFWPVTQLAQLIKSRKLRSVELTRMYLDRLKRFDPILKCVVTITEELALEQARQADTEIAAGHYRGPLHGIPWGAKDLIAKKGYRTTWGAPLFRDRILDTDATVVSRLEKAGAVLIAKLSTGELAHDDVWFGGQTKNPWDLQEGANGSSAGPGSATAAGLVGFAIGTETGGSIVAPAIRCGVTSLRPTFGRVSRHGVMPGAWSFDKVGPMCRAVEDCALVFNSIYGSDGRDLTVVDLPFNWNAGFDCGRLRVGYLRAAFEEERHFKEEKPNDEATLEKLRSLGITPQPVELPNLPIESAGLLSAFCEIGAVWDEMIRTNQDALLVRQDSDHIGNLCRTAQTIPAVEYVQSGRVRTLIMEAMAGIMAKVDVYLAPYSSLEPSGPASELNLLLTNLTGYPAVVVPNGFTKKGNPTGITFIGNLYGEAELLALAKAYQDATDFHRKHPKLPDPRGKDRIKS